MTAKKLVPLFLFSIFIYQASAQEASTFTTEEYVLQVVNKPLKKGESMFIEVADFAAGVATPYTYKKETVKVERILQLPYGIWQTNYYYNKGKLVMIEDTEETFLINENGEIDFSEKEKNYHARFYFLNDKLVESNEAGEKRNASERFFNAEMELIQAKLYASEL